MAQRLILLVGTTKGAFFFHSDQDREYWTVTGPHLPGWQVYSLLGDNRHQQRIFAGTSSEVYGPTIRFSDDFGETWTQVAGSPQFSKESGFKLRHIWQIVPGHASQPDMLFAGVDDAALFVSRDRGESWAEVASLTAHPSRPAWFAGNGGLALHTILVDPGNPKRVWIAISAVAAFRTDDGGQSWKICTNGIPDVVTGDEFPPMKAYPEIGRCVHKMALDPDDSNTLYMQHHGGVLKSTDAGDSWFKIEKGLPGNFGFPLGISARGDLFVVPEDEDTRCVPDGRLCLYRSRNRGASWERIERGLPGQSEYVGVLRDSLAVDAFDPAGVYFGTTMGELYCSRDDGSSWKQLPGQYPRITTVKTWILDD
jgi:photosystem II stability/assembly factor-like uncharacterized protein